MIKFKTAAIAASALALPLAAYAATAGQIEGGNIYRIKNITQNVDFTDPASAKACDVLEYKVRIHNPGPDALTSVNVKATLDSNVATSHSSLVTVSATNANPATTTDTAAVNIADAQGINYVAGSTQLLDAHNGVLSNLPDGITSASGVTFGDVGVSTEQIRYVQFQVKVNCPTPTTPVTPVATASAPAALPQTGAEAGLGAMAGTGALGYAVMSYRRSKRALANKLLDRK